MNELVQVVALYKSDLQEQHLSLVFAYSFKLRRTFDLVVSREEGIYAGIVFEFIVGKTNEKNRIVPVEGSVKKVINNEYDIDIRQDTGQIWLKAHIMYITSIRALDGATISELSVWSDFGIVNFNKSESPTKFIDSIANNTVYITWIRWIDSKGFEVVGETKQMKDKEEHDKKRKQLEDDLEYELKQLSQSKNDQRVAEAKKAFTADSYDRNAVNRRFSQLSKFDSRRGYTETSQIKPTKRNQEGSSRIKMEISTESRFLIVLEPTERLTGLAWCRSVGDVCLKDIGIARTRAKLMLGDWFEGTAKPDKKCDINVLSRCVVQRIDDKVEDGTPVFIGQSNNNGTPFILVETRIEIIPITNPDDRVTHRGQTQFILHDFYFAKVYINETLYNKYLGKIICAQLRKIRTDQNNVSWLIHNIMQVCDALGNYTQVSPRQYDDIPSEDVYDVSDKKVKCFIDDDSDDDSDAEDMPSADPSRNNVTDEPVRRDGNMSPIRPSPRLPHFSSMRGNRDDSDCPTSSPYADVISNQYSTMDPLYDGQQLVSDIVGLVTSIVSYEDYRLAIIFSNQCTTCAYRCLPGRLNFSLGDYISFDYFVLATPMRECKVLAARAKRINPDEVATRNLYPIRVRRSDNGSGVVELLCHLMFDRAKIGKLYGKDYIFTSEIGEVFLPKQCRYEIKGQHVSVYEEMRGMELCCWAEYRYCHENKCYDWYLNSIKGTIMEVEAMDPNSTWVSNDKDKYSTKEVKEGRDRSVYPPSHNTTMNTTLSDSIDTRDLSSSRSSSVFASRQSTAAYNQLTAGDENRTGQFIFEIWQDEYLKNAMKVRNYGLYSRVEAYMVDLQQISMEVVERDFDRSQITPTPSYPPRRSTVDHPSPPPPTRFDNGHGYNNNDHQRYRTGP